MDDPFFRKFFDRFPFEAPPEQKTKSLGSGVIVSKNGYIVTLDGVRIYHAGDTDHIPEMKRTACDIALLPVSGTYVMTAEEAAAAVPDIGCKLAIPMHWGDIIGSREDAETFEKLAPCEVHILDITQ